MAVVNEHYMVTFEKRKFFLRGGEEAFFSGFNLGVTHSLKFKIEGLKIYPRLNLTF